MSAQVKPEWADKLAKALGRWCEENRCSPKNILALKLDIPQKEWKRISIGDAVVSNTVNYAKLYLRTDLPEADPRTIPPLRRVVPKTGNFNTFKRKWTEEEWQSWLKSKEAEEIQKLKIGTEEGREKKRPSEPMVVAQTETIPPFIASAKMQTIGSLLDSVLAIFAKQMAEEMGNTIASKIADAIDNKASLLMKQFNHPLPTPPKDKPNLSKTEPKAERSASLNAGELATGLKLLLGHGSEEDREKVYRHYKEQLLDLLPILDAYTTSSDNNEREARLRLIPK